MKTKSKKRTTTKKMEKSKANLNSNANAKTKRKNPKNVIEFSREIPSVPKDLLIICKDDSNHDHQQQQHLIHSFPLYIMSPYFHKAILFNHVESDDDNDNHLKRLYLPFSCDVIEKLIEFAYTGRLQQQQSLSVELINELERLARWTSSIRMLNYLEHHWKNEKQQQRMKISQKK